MARVSIHAPVKGATVEGVHILFPSFCFNPRAREGRDVDARHDGRAALVSIHAPVKGATVLGVAAMRHERVSIHAPVKGATTGVALRTPARLFQSTRP